MFLVILINLKKNKTLISYFPAHFPWHNQTLENVFQLIFHYTIKYWKIIYFPGIYFSKIYFFKKTIFQQINRTLMMLNKIKKNKSDQTNLVQLWEMILYPVVCRTIHDMCNVRVVGIKSRWQALPLVELLQICANRRVQDSGSFWSLPWSWHGNDTRE